MPATDPGDSDGTIPDNAGILDYVALGVQVHIGGGGRGSFLAVVDEVGLAVGHADEHESAAAEVARLRMNDGEREADGHCGVHRVTSRLHDLDTCLRSQPMNTGHHGMGGMGWKNRALQRRDSGYQGRQKQQNQWLAVESHGIVDWGNGLSGPSRRVQLDPSAIRLGKQALGRLLRLA